MTTKQIALDHLQRINSGDVDGAAALLADDCVNHSAVPEAQGRAGFVTIMKKVRTAFPDMTYKIEDTIVDGDRAVVRVMARGTHTGPLGFTRFQVPATGKPVEFEQIHILRVANDKIVEHWLGQDSLAFFRQLGVQLMPPT